ncbi:putative bifunctional diguanylate cyclase/phosphodiesterase [Nesterenkonia sandarakina]|uniref:PAS domain S-box-containing protein/diguanylate cyclase (GGDEF)-like protein n=1 Tax=Nesterenkonia sandarakina TaxID=272918 RepID=A0A2T0YGT2_9MICC|nr:bifunctional diguanylate cyclase/phosphodiesterase [Nesterenkonia sandarakina]PRZ14219.1 PAS domain S-box-containing protein/diguanylate cyclase (GGDEF)-like protein [Nesterenkonia sandarakina]
MDTCNACQGHYRDLLEMYPDPVVMVAASGLMVAVSDLAAEVFGYSPEELLGMPPELLIGGAPDPTAVARALTAQQLLISRMSSGQELRGRRKDGTEFPAEVSLRQLSVGEARLTLASVRDVTALREAEAQRREAEQVFALGARHFPIGIAIADIDGRLTRVNPAACTVLGRSAENLIGHLLSEFIHPSHSEEGSLFDQVLIDHADNSCQVCRYLRPDGEVVHVEKTVVLLRDNAGNPESFYVQLQDITARKKVEAELEQLANHDPLTGLANRRLMTEQLTRSLARAARVDEQVTVLFIDLDQFKVVNDARGHASGDALLLQLATRLKKLTRRSDLLARFGGDEFVIVCDDLNTEGAEKLGGRIAAAAHEPFMLDGEEIFASVSIGIAFSEPGDTADSLLRKSDVAMYDVKETGRAGAAVFDDQMQRKATQRMATKTHLGGALRRNELRLRFQPIMDLRTDAPVGFEALVRWEHPQRGLLSPSEFLPVAEESGLIVDLGRWVLENALRQLRDWESRLPDVRDLSIAVNVSTRQLQDPGCISFTEETLALTGVDPRRLHLEITETTLMGDVEAAIRHMTQAAELGVRLGIDDFWVGHSSLSYLHRLPAHTLKIDKSFIQDLGGTETRPTLIVETIIRLAHALGLDVIAEGVETETQRAELCRLGSDKAQGYLWARPLSPDDALA